MRVLLERLSSAALRLVGQHWRPMRRPATQYECIRIVDYASGTESPRGPREYLSSSDAREVVELALLARRWRRQVLHRVPTQYAIQNKL